jgi:hypothetical protein
MLRKMCVAATSLLRDSYHHLFMDKFVSADTDQSPQIHLDLEQTVTEYYSFPSSTVLNGQEKKDDVLTL